MDTNIRFKSISVSGDVSFLNGEVNIGEEDAPYIIITMALPYHGDGTLAELRGEFQRVAREALNEPVLRSWWQAHAK